MKKEQTLNELIDSLPGKIVKNDFEHIDENIPVANQSFLDEDMLQIEFKNNFILDIGWYGRDGKGSFIVHVIHGYDWQHPLQKIKCHTFKSLKSAVQKAANYIINTESMNNRILQYNKENSFLSLIKTMHGKILHNELSNINENIPLENQLFSLTEHMLEIKFDNIALLVGWYCKRKPNDTFEMYKNRGHFIVYAILYQKDNSYLTREVILKEITCKTLNALKSAVQDVYSFIKNKY